MKIKRNKRGKKSQLLEAVEQGQKARRLGLTNYYVPWKDLCKLDDQYAKGYKRQPEYPREYEALFLAGLRSFSPWESRPKKRSQKNG